MPAGEEVSLAVPELSFEERKTRLVKAATQVFARKGFAASNKEIAAEAGITAAALYWYFPSKEDLLWAVIDQHWPDPAQIRASLWAARDLPPRAVLPRLVDGVATSFFNEEMRPLITVLVQESIRNPTIAKVYEERFVASIAGALTAYFAYQIERGVFKPGKAEVYVPCFMGPLAIAGVFKFVLNQGWLARVEVREIIQTAVDLFLTGILTTQEETRHG